jgi:hypothetical protein
MKFGSLLLALSLMQSMTSLAPRGEGKESHSREIDTTHLRLGKHIFNGG